MGLKDRLIRKTLLGGEKSHTMQKTMFPARKQGGKDSHCLEGNM